MTASRSSGAQSSRPIEPAVTGRPGRSTKLSR
jgi:hypothetical protein